MQIGYLNPMKLNLLVDIYLPLVEVQFHGNLASKHVLLILPWNLSILPSKKHVLRLNG